MVPILAFFREKLSIVRDEFGEIVACAEHSDVSGARAAGPWARMRRRGEKEVPDLLTA